MYCPNCGKDCGNSNFCPNCGKKLSVQAAAPSAWAPGMPCPHCGGIKLDGKNCAFCGMCLISQQSEIVAPQFPDPPLGKYCYWGREGYIIISDNYIRIFRIEVPQWGWGRKDRTVYFKDLYSMKFVPAKTFGGGMLSIRTWDERSIPFPQSRAEIEADECSFDFLPKQNAEFYKIALFLQQCVRIANAVRPKPEQNT